MSPNRVCVSPKSPPGRCPSRGAWPPGLDTPPSAGHAPALGRRLLWPRPPRWDLSCAGYAPLPARGGVASVPQPMGGRTEEEAGPDAAAGRSRCQRCPRPVSREPPPSRGARAGRSRLIKWRFKSKKRTFCPVLCVGTGEARGESVRFRHGASRHALRGANRDAPSAPRGAARRPITARRRRRTRGSANGRGFLSWFRNGLLATGVGVIAHVQSDTGRDAAYGFFALGGLCVSWASLSYSWALLRLRRPLLLPLPGALGAAGGAAIPALLWAAALALYVGRLEVEVGTEEPPPE
ncbi:transmembrane protein 160 isoform X1 [Patagioenas fasciata]|uniref:transmembrane protein 160 isoform X1 n=1 Tax=Patagioenas fasciata TaxID=372321 RepID=UPI003A993834